MRHKHAIQDTQHPQSRKELNNTLQLKDTLHRETHFENITGSMILPDISILYIARTSNKIHLVLLEALLIKQHKPTIINTQNDDFNRILNIF